MAGPFDDSQVEWGVAILSGPETPGGMKDSLEGMNGSVHCIAIWTDCRVVKKQLLIFSAPTILEQAQHLLGLFGF